jgi:hypothetical protein
LRNRRYLRELKHQHWALAPDQYTLHDLVAAGNGTLLTELSRIVELYRDHVYECEVCEPFFWCSSCVGVETLTHVLNEDETTDCHNLTF